jgi:predicted  nucleic acid-binding Zn-ribbon protein
MNEIKDLYAVETEIAKLQDQIMQHSLKRQEIQEDLACINRKLKTRQTHSKFESLSRRRDRLKSDLLLLEKAIAPVKSELRQWQAISTDLRAKSMVRLNVEISSNKTLIEKIRTLRSHYLAFAEDQTRVNSMRVMAAQFANELTALLSES